MDIEINIIWIIVVIALAMGGMAGFKRGLVEGVIRITSDILGIAVLVILVKGIGCFIQGNILSVLMALILLAIIRILHRLVKLLLDSCRLVSRLPVVKWVDRLAGTLLGIARVVCVIWIIFILVGYFDPGHFNDWLLTQVRESTLLSMIYHTNYFIKLIQML